jgi:hypothetical protein
MSQDYQVHLFRRTIGVADDEALPIFFPHSLDTGICPHLLRRFDGEVRPVTFFGSLKRAQLWLANP